MIMPMIKSLLSYTIAASAVIAASVAEGFGLPLVEALMREKPLIASDIPAFREVAGSAPLFFKAGDADSLSATIQDYLSTPRVQPTQTQHWLTWDQSANMLMKEISQLKDAETSALGERS